MTTKLGPNGVLIWVQVELRILLEKLTTRYRLCIYREALFVSQVP